jgi:hypothetical protein
LATNGRPKAREILLQVQTLWCVVDDNTLRKKLLFKIERGSAEDAAIPPPRAQQRKQVARGDRRAAGGVDVAVIRGEQQPRGAAFPDQRVRPLIGSHGIDLWALDPPPPAPSLS